MTWQSSLQLSFDHRASTEKTRLYHCLHQGALMVQRALYPEPDTTQSELMPSNTASNPNNRLINKPNQTQSSPETHSLNPIIKRPSQSGICHIYVLYPPAGIADGDKLTMDFELKANSHAVITTPGAGKWYGQRKSIRPTDSTLTENANKNNNKTDTKIDLQTANPKQINPVQTTTDNKPKAEQNILVKLADNAILEWLPQESIYFDHSVSNASSHFHLAPTASLMTWDIAVFGRQAYNETFANGQYNNRLQIWREDQLLVSEHTQQHADSRWFHSPLGLNNQHVHGSFWAVPSIDIIDSEAQNNPLKLGQFLDQTIAELRQLIDQHSLPIESTHNYQAINCRYIGTDVRACFEAFYQARELLRNKWYQLQPHRPRIWDT